MSTESKQTDNKKPNKQKSSDAFMHKILVVLLAVMVLAMTLLVFYALRGGINMPRVASGKVVPQASAQRQESESSDAASTEPSSESTEPSEPVDLELAQAQDILSNMTLEEKVWQMIFASADSLEGVYGVSVADDHTKQSIQSYPVGGVAYFGQNISSAEQITNLTSTTQSYSEIPLFIGVDEEGGTVARLEGYVTEYYDDMSTYGASGDTAQITQIGSELAADLLSAGFNLDFAPVADVLTNPYNYEIGKRAFGSDPVLVANMASAMMESLQDGGICACMKHFPGHGSTYSDSHYGQSVSERTLEELRETEFLPFKEGINKGVGMIMMSHMSLPNVTGDYTPCDLSYKVVTELLRDELGYDGVIITDSHEMGAVSYFYDCGSAAVMAVQAGCDMILMPANIEAAYAAIYAAVESGEISQERIDESVLRILLLKCKMDIIE